MYSQYGEDDIIARLLDEMSVGQVGRLLDIGAWDPIDKSNSRLLIERGWSAVLVEFSPTAARKLVTAYGRCKEVAVLQAAVTPCDSGLARFEISDDGLSSNDAAIIEKWAGEAGYLGGLWVPRLPVQDLLSQFGGGYDFISVDTEGSSVEVAIALLNAQQLPRVMCVEHDGRTIELMQAAQDRGYAAQWANGTNIILAR